MRQFQPLREYNDLKRLKAIKGDLRSQSRPQVNLRWKKKKKEKKNIT